MEKERCGNVLKPCMGELCRFFQVNFECFTAEWLYEMEPTVQVHFVKPRNLDKRVQVHHQRKAINGSTIKMILI